MWDIPDCRVLDFIDRVQEIICYHFGTTPEKMLSNKPPMQGSRAEARAYCMGFLSATGLFGCLDELHSALTNSRLSKKSLQRNINFMRNRVWHENNPEILKESWVTNDLDTATINLFEELVDKWVVAQEGCSRHLYNKPVWEELVKPDAKPAE